MCATAAQFNLETGSALNSAYLCKVVNDNYDVVNTLLVSILTPSPIAYFTKYALEVFSSLLMAEIYAPHSRLGKQKTTT